MRGYGFQGVGPRDPAGNPTGGASLVEFSLEARIETPLFDGAGWKWCPFVDAGSVARGIRPRISTRSVTGPGSASATRPASARIRVDVATPINPNRFD